MYTQCCFAQLKHCVSFLITRESLNSCTHANECSVSEECVLHLYCEPGDPLAAGLSERAVGIYTAGRTGYMTARISACVFTHNDLIISPGGAKSSL